MRMNGTPNYNKHLLSTNQAKRVLASLYDCGKCAWSTSHLWTPTRLGLGHSTHPVLSTRVNLLGQQNHTFCPISKKRAINQFFCQKKPGYELRSQQPISV